MTPMTEEQFNDCISRVSEQRREKVLKYRFQTGREQSLKAYMLLQRLLKEEYGITEPPVFRELENGKPVIIGHEDIHFNMSHCKYAVACAISNEPVGIDVEVVKEKVKDELARYVLSDEELEDLTPLKFTRLWTLKEAVVILTGRGITGKEQLRPLLDDFHKGKSPWQIITKDFPEKNYVVSICYKPLL
jgi:4'-phosphopantetheinyl transferase